MVVAGVILVLVAGAVALAGAFLTWAHATQRDDDGFFSTSTERLDTTATAITTDDLDFDVSPDAADWVGDLATVRIEVDGVTEGTETPAPAFVGIGPADEVAAYLEGVSQARIDDVDLDPFRVEYDFTAGTAMPAPPDDQDFWAAVGGDGQPLEWDIEDGNWVAVIMNADGSPGVSVDVAVGAKAGWLLPVALVLLIGGFLVALGGTLLLVFGAVGLSRHPAAAPAPDRGEAVAIGIAPVRVAGHQDDQLSRWLWLVKWFLLIPHFIVLAALWVAVWVVSVIAWFAIVFTGRYPAALFDFTVGVLRWTWRVGFYSYAALGTDEYPPFSLAARPGDPALLEIDRPERLSRGLVWVKSWLLAIPQLLIVAVLAGGWTWSVDDGRGGPGLIGLLVFIAGVSLLFTTRYPSGLFDLVVGLNRWVFRVLAYVLLLRDEYPPFRLDQGPDEPGGGS
jgi:hypothetical protein